MNPNENTTRPRYWLSVAYGRIGTDVWVFANFFFLHKFKTYYQFFRRQGFNRMTSISQSIALFDMAGYPLPSKARTLNFETEEPVEEPDAAAAA